MAKKPKSEKTDFLEIENTENPSIKSEDENKKEKVNELIEEVKEKKRETRGRKSKVSKEEEQTKENFITVATINASLVLNLIVTRLPKPQPLTEQEALNFDKAFTQLAEKYYNSLGKFGVEINFIAALSFILASRIDFSKLKRNKKFENPVNIRQDGNRKDNTMQEVN